MLSVQRYDFAICMRVYDAIVKRPLEQYMLRNPSQADRKRAHAEGWRFAPGYVMPKFDARGMALFKDPYEVVMFLYGKSRESEWHREIYLELPYTLADENISKIQGWMMVGLSGYGPTIPEIKSCARHIFSSNEEARAHVLKAADEGDPLCIKALRAASKKRLLSGV